GVERAADEAPPPHGEQWNDGQQRRVGHPGHAAHDEAAGALALAVRSEIAPVAVYRATHEAASHELSDGPDVGEQWSHARRIRGRPGPWLTRQQLPRNHLEL